MKRMTPTLVKSVTLILVKPPIINTPLQSTMAVHFHAHNQLVKARQMPMVIGQA